MAKNSSEGDKKKISQKIVFGEGLLHEENFKFSHETFICKTRLHTKPFQKLASCLQNFFQFHTSLLKQSKYDTFHLTMLHCEETRVMCTYRNRHVGQILLPSDAELVMLPINYMQPVFIFTYYSQNIFHLVLTVFI